MTDRNRVQALQQALYTSSTTFTITPGTGGGSAFTITPPYKLRLMTTQGSNTSNGTELTGTGYSAGGSTLGSSAFGAPSAGVQTNNNPVSWSVGSSWSTVPAIEIWDSAGTPLRWLQGALTSSITGAANGDTVTFAAASISLDASGW
jgi:hypothetical protein